MDDEFIAVMRQLIETIEINTEQLLENTKAVKQLEKVSRPHLAIVSDSVAG